MPKVKYKKTPHEITAKVTQYAPPAMFLRENMASATCEGRTITVDKNVNGDCLIFGVTGADGERQYVVDTLSLVYVIHDLHESLKAKRPVV